MRIKKYLLLRGAIILIFFTFNSGIFAQNNTWFVDVTAQTGLSGLNGGGCITVDVTNDKYPDILMLGPNWKLLVNADDPNSANPLDRIFVDSTANSGLVVAGMNTGLASFADFNNDGNIDILVNNWYHNLIVSGNTCINNPDNGSNSKMHVLLGDGKTHFALVVPPGALEAIGPMPNVGMPTFDYDKDGNIDIFIGNHYTNWCGVPFGNFIMKGNGDGTFKNVTSTSNIGSNLKPLFGSNIADWNNDCNSDIFTAPYLTMGSGNLWQNNANGTFTDKAPTTGYNPHFLPGDNGQAMVPWAAMPSDFDNDGDLDFLVLEVHGGNDPGEGRSAIFTNQGSVSNYSLIPNQNTITRSNPQSTHHGDHNGWWLDFDNDGWQDIILGNATYQAASDRMYFLKQNTSNNFVDVTQSLGFMSTTAASISDNIRHPSVMLAFDYDQDGDEDIIKCPYDTYSVTVFRNDAANSNKHISINLEAPMGVNKSCIGTRVYVKAGGIKQMKEVYGEQGSFTNQAPLQLIFGLGSSTIIDSIYVRWPNSVCSQTILTNVAVNQNITITQNNLCSPPTYPGSISGSAQHCPGTTHIFSISPVSGATSYIWVLPGGSTGVSLTNTISVLSGSNSGIIGVAASNSCGTSPNTTLSINVTINNPGPINGTTTACIGVQDFYSISPVAGAVSYTWTLPNGWTGTSSSSGINLTPGSNSGVVTVAITNSCGAVASSSLSVNVANCSVGINQYVMNGFDSYLSIYPNPNKGNFFIDYKNNLMQLNVSVSNLLGQEIYSAVLNSNLKNEIRLPENKGMYFLKIYDSKNHLVMQKKIIID